MATGTKARHGGNIALILGAIALGVPGIIFRVVGVATGHDISETSPALSSLVFGIGIAGAAFLLSWAAEAAQKDISASLAIAVLALIALLPEYSVEAFLAWDAGANLSDPHAVGRLAANVTGANRLLIALGWSLVAIVFWFRVRGGLRLPAALTRELAILAIATAISFLILLLGGVTLILGVVMIGVYAVYLILNSLAESHEPDLAGPSALIGDLPKWWRRVVVVLLLAYAAALIIASVEPFVHGLISTGRRFGIDDFLLIQWLAPLASESPEMVVALIYTARANPAAGITVLISAGVNQLTVLIGSMPVIYSISAGQFLAVQLEHRQIMEFFLTSSLSVFAVVLLARRWLGILPALGLLALFFVQLVFYTSTAHLILSAALLLTSLGMIARDPGRVALLTRYVVEQATVLAHWARRRPLPDLASEHEPQP